MHAIYAKLVIYTDHGWNLISNARRNIESADNPRGKWSVTPLHHPAKRNSPPNDLCMTWQGHETPLPMIPSFHPCKFNWKGSMCSMSLWWTVTLKADHSLVQATTGSGRRQRESIWRGSSNNELILRQRYLVLARQFMERAGRNQSMISHIQMLVPRCQGTLSPWPEIMGCPRASSLLSPGDTGLRLFKCTPSKVTHPLSQTWFASWRGHRMFDQIGREAEATKHAIDNGH